MGKGERLAFLQAGEPSDLHFLLQGVKVCRSFSEAW